MKCEKCKQEIKEKKETIKIYSRYDSNKIIYECEAETIKEAVEKAVKEGVSLEDVNLGNVNLENVNLKFANLKNANLENANLEYANLEYANLEYANLEGAKTKYCIINFSKFEYKQAKQFIEGLKL